MVPILSKILENTVSEQVGGYLEDNSLLHLHQGAIDVEEVQKMLYCMQLHLTVHSLEAGNTVCAAFLEASVRFS